MGYKMMIKLDEGAKMPTRAHILDAGYDVFSREDAEIPPMGSHVFDTGVHVTPPPWHFLKIEGRSGLNINNSVVSLGGVIDEGYTGSIRVKLYNLGATPYRVERGDRIAQMILLVYAAPDTELFEEMVETDRGDSGFGSTGR